MTKSEAEKTIKKIRKEMTLKIKEMRRNNSPLKDMKKQATIYRDRIEDIRELFPGAFESAY